MRRQILKHVAFDFVSFNWQVLHTRFQLIIILNCVQNSSFAYNNLFLGVLTSFKFQGMILATEKKNITILFVNLTGEKCMEKTIFNGVTCGL